MTKNRQTYEMDQTAARALTEAGYMPLPEYLRLCEMRGWKETPSSGAEAPK